MSYDLDSHKLSLHPHKVAQWLDNEAIVEPLTVELSPTKRCNLRCNFCAFDYRKDFTSWSLNLTQKIAHDLVNSSWKPASVVLGGEGEPLLGIATDTLARLLADAGIRVGIITNGTVDSIPNFTLRATWIRFSINAKTPDTYARIHGTSPLTLEKVLDNLNECCEKRGDHKPPTTIGVQALYLPESRHELVDLAGLVREIGVDYFVVKPYSHHPQSNHETIPGPSERDISNLSQQLHSLQTGEFRVIVRDNAFRAARTMKAYRHCLAAPFFHLIDSQGDVYPCAQFVGKEEWVMGSMKVQSWSEVCQSARRREVLERLAKDWNVAACRQPCRLEEANKYLNRIVNPTEHDAFL